MEESIEYLCDKEVFEDVLSGKQKAFGLYDTIKQDTLIDVIELTDKSSPERTGRKLKTKITFVERLECNEPEYDVWIASFEVLEGENV